MDIKKLLEAVGISIGVIVLCITIGAFLIWLATKSILFLWAICILLFLILMVFIYESL